MTRLQLFPYQYEGAKWLAAQRFALLADGMGLGKTPQAIGAASMAGVRSTIVICPAIARTMWRREWANWRGPGRIRVYSYDEAVRGKHCRAAFAEDAPDLLILDEAHYLKSAKAKRTQLIYGTGCEGNGLGGLAQRIWLLTGTPAPNDVGELWPHLRALWPQFLDGRKRYIDFLDEFTHHMPSIYGVRVTGNKKEKMPKLRALLHSVMLRRKVEDVLHDLPPIIYQHHTVDPERITPELAAVEASPQTVAALAILGDADADPSNLDAVAMSSLRRLTGEAKAPVVARQIAHELAQNAYAKIVVFAVHRNVLSTLFDSLADFAPAYIDGSTSATGRQRAIDRFQSDPECRVFIGQLQACATAVTLHAGSQVAFVEMSWAPADNAQAAKRVHRIGQTRPVVVRMFGLAGSIDDAIARVLARKCRLVDQVIEVTK